MPFIDGKFHANPAYGRAVEGARPAEAASGGRSQQDQGDHWFTINGHHVLIHESLPNSGLGSIYADMFEGRPTSNGDIFHQDGYTAALLPRFRWQAVPLGTKVKLTSGTKSVVVEINDRGAGDRQPESPRVLDLSRAAASALTGQQIDNDQQAKRVGLIRLDKIQIVSARVPPGPGRP